MVWYIERCQKHTLLKKNYQKKRKKFSIYKNCSKKFEKNKILSQKKKSQAFVVKIKLHNFLATKTRLYL